MSTIAHERFEAVIGLEVHAQLLTKSKAFAPVPPIYGEAPNTMVTPLCLGHPGTLPVVNENLVRYIIKMGLATNCQIAPKSIFARKNYFYPDLPKGYQISQFETPICHDGFVDIELEEYDKRIGVTRIHMEEDAGKSIHDQDPYNTLVDLNRAGTPLIEIVSEPDLRTPQEAYAYLTKIKQIVQYLEICDGNMEEGSLRCDANVSVRPRGQKEFGTRTELKNMNSFRNVEKAIEYEIYRQIELIEGGGTVVQQTRLWDTSKMQSRPMRSKEEAHDYRYFPEPDLPPIIVSDEMKEEIRAELPELADVRQKRFVSEYGMSEDDAKTLTEDKYLADFFEREIGDYPNPLDISNFIKTHVLRTLNEDKKHISEVNLPTGSVQAIVSLNGKNEISSSNAVKLYDEIYDSFNNFQNVLPDQDFVTGNITFLKGNLDTNPESVSNFVPINTSIPDYSVRINTDLPDNTLVYLPVLEYSSAKGLAEKLNLIQVSDSGFLEELVDEIIANNPDEVERYRGGKKQLMGFFVGQAMKASKGKANPKMVTQMVAKKLEG